MSGKNLFLLLFFITIFLMLICLIQIDSDLTATTITFFDILLPRCL